MANFWVRHLGSVIIALLCAGCGMEGLSGPGRTTTLGYDLSLLKPRVAQSTTSAPAPSTPFHVAVAQAGASVPDPLLLRRFEMEKKLFGKVSGLPAAIALRDFGSEIVQEDPERLLALAEQMGADVLILIGGQVEAESSRTAASLADATIIGHYVLPTARVEASGRALAAVISVRERRLLYTEMADADTSGLSPSVSRHRKTDRAADTVRGKLLSTLADAVIADMANRAGIKQQSPVSAHRKTKAPTVRTRSTTPVATIYIISDGFHVGLVLPIRVNESANEWMEVGLGERNWAMESGMTWLRGLMAMTTQNDGIAVAEYLNAPELADKKATMKRVWRVELSEDDWGRLISALENEMLLQEVLYDSGANGKVVKTRDGYSLFHTCHHFALNPLGRTGRQLGGGFPKPTPLLEKRIDAALKSHTKK